MTKIHKIGFELEGEFSRLLMAELGMLGVDVGGDGSIRPCVRSKHDGLHLAEIRTKPYARVSRLEDIIEKIGESEGEYHWNKSMGFHIHISFIDRATKSDVPVEVWSSAFNKYFLEKARDTFKTVYKAREGNHYCYAEPNRTDRDIASLNDRYRAINYLPAFTAHGTVEFRLWPADSAEKLLRYFRFTIATVNEFLAMADDVLAIKESEDMTDKERREDILERVQKLTRWDGYGNAVERTKKVVKLFNSLSRNINYHV